MKVFLSLLYLKEFMQHCKCIFFVYLTGFHTEAICLHLWFSSGNIFKLKILPHLHMWDGSNFLTTISQQWHGWGWLMVDDLMHAFAAVAGPSAMAGLSHHVMCHSRFPHSTAMQSFNRRKAQAFKFFDVSHQKSVSYLCSQVRKSMSQDLIKFKERKTDSVPWWWLCKGCGRIYLHHCLLSDHTFQCLCKINSNSTKTQKRLN